MAITQAQKESRHQPGHQYVDAMQRKTNSKPVQIGVVRNGAVSEPVEQLTGDFYDRHPKLTREINRYFRIRVYLMENGKKVERLVGAGKIDRYLSDEAAIKLFKRAQTSFRDKETYWTKNGLRIEIIDK